MAHWAVRLLQHFIQSETACGSVGNIKDQYVKLRLLMGSERTPDQALRLEAAKVAATMPARLQVIRAGAAKGPQSSGTNCSRSDRPI
jgi:hypothetical protein